VTDWQAPHPRDGERHDLYLQRVIADMEQHLNTTLRQALYRKAGDREAAIERLDQITGS
jgi:hypothetical protein